MFLVFFVFNNGNRYVVMHHHTLLKPNSSKIYFYLITGEDFEVVQKEVSEILNGRLLIGHAIHNDLKVNNRDNDMCILNFVDDWTSKNYCFRISLTYIYSTPLLTTCNTRPSIPFTMKKWPLMRGMTSFE